MAGNGNAERGQPGHTPGAGWVPVPDPTELTIQAVAAATEVFRRELQNLREIIEARMEGNDRDRDTLWAEVRSLPGRLETVLGERRREFAGDLAGAQQLIEQRLDSMDKAIELAVRELEKYVDQARRERDGDTRAEREFILALIENVRAVTTEKFTAVDGRFSESKTAVDAAFAAAKEAVAEQNKSNSREIGKSEAATKEQLASLSRVTDAGIGALTDKITDARDRITTIESLTRGIEQAGGESRAERGLAHSGTQLALFSVAILVSVISAVIGIIALVHH